MSPVGMIHTAFAVIAMAAGLAIFTITKGTRLHRAIGYLYVFSMLTMNITSLTIYRLFGGFGPFHAAAIFSLVTVTAGFIPVFTRRPKGSWLQLHYDFISWSYVGLLAAAASEFLTRVPFFDQSGTAFAAGVFIASAVVFLGGFLIIYRKRQSVINNVLSRIKI